MDECQRDSSKYWSSNASLDYYSTSRKELKDLYDSERVFLPRMLKEGMRVLDVGCAAGGFYNIMKEIEPGIEYHGCDISPELIRKAKETYGEEDFVVADSTSIPFSDNHFDLVNCAGTCHMMPDYFDAIKQMYRVSRKYCIFDVRLTDKASGPDVSGCYQKLCFNNDEWDGESISPYVILNGWDFLKRLLKDLTPKPKAIYATGYLRAPADTVTAPFDEVCMTVFMVEKGVGELRGPTELCLDMPYDYSQEDNFKCEKWYEPSALSNMIEEKMRTFKMQGVAI